MAGPDAGRDAKVTQRNGAGVERQWSLSPIDSIVSSAGKKPARSERDRVITMQRALRERECADVVRLPPLLPLPLTMVGWFRSRSMFA
jgi:hypothetical protein